MNLRVDHLSFAYGLVPALREIDVKAGAGRITAVIGPNAAGKSTLLRCMIGALRPSEGCVRIDGREAHLLRARQVAQWIAYVPQRSVVSAAFTVRQVIELGRFALPASKRRIDQALEQLELTDVADRRHQTLSVGQQQRVTLARALAQLEPGGCLILDEPMSAMDLRHVRLSLSLLAVAAGQGSTVILAIHDLIQALRHAEDVWVLKGGRLVASGETRQILDQRLLQDVFGVPFVSLATMDGGQLMIPSSR